jgi:hypothetical protein
VVVRERVGVDVSMSVGAIVGVSVGVGVNADGVMGGCKVCVRGVGVNVQGAHIPAATPDELRYSSS